MPVVTIVTLQRIRSLFCIGVTTRDPQLGLPKDWKETKNSKEFFACRIGQYSIHSVIVELRKRLLLITILKIQWDAPSKMESFFI